MKQKTYLDKLLEDKVFKEKFEEEYLKMTIEEIWDKIDYGTDKEKLEAEAELLGRLLYYTGD